VTQRLDLIDAHPARIAADEVWRFVAGSIRPRGRPRCRSRGSHRSSVRLKPCNFNVLRSFFRRSAADDRWTRFAHPAPQSRPLGQSRVPALPVPAL
jgi:hypothetical protein